MYPTALVNHWVDPPVPPEPVPSVPVVELASVDIERTGTAQDLFDWQELNFLSQQPPCSTFTGILVQLRMNWTGQSDPFVLRLQYTDNDGQLIDFTFWHMLEAGSQNPLSIVASAQLECLVVCSDDTTADTDHRDVEIVVVDHVFALDNMRIRCTDATGGYAIANLSGFHLVASAYTVVPTLLPQLTSNSN
jgi:hypothetical protein